MGTRPGTDQVKSAVGETEGTLVMEFGNSCNNIVPESGKPPNSLLRLLASDPLQLPPDARLLAASRASRPPEHPADSTHPGNSLPPNGWPAMPPLASNSLSDLRAVEVTPQ